MESLRKQVEEHLTCSICLEQFKDPKFLPCFHSYCHECLAKLARSAKSKNIICPKCRTEVKVKDPQNLSDLPSNFFINNLLATMALTNDQKGKRIVCDNCESDNAAETRCKECCMFLCQSCSEFHRKSRPTKRHGLTSMHELKSSAGPVSVAEKIRCTKHKEEVIRLFCRTCQTTICRDCTIVDHRQHDYGFVEDVASQERRNLQQNLNEVKRRSDRVKEGISNLKKFDEGLKVRKSSVISEINKHFDKLAKVIESRRRELVGTTTSLIGIKQKQIHAQLEQLEVALGSCESSIEFTEQAFKNGNDVQILSTEKYILHSLRDLKSIKDQTQPCVTDTVVFNIPWSIQDTKVKLLNLLTVYDSVASPRNCTASFDEPETDLQAGKQSTITLVCSDKNNKRLMYGGQEVKPKFSGVEVSNVAIIDNKDGSHKVKFCARHVGFLKFEVTINGHLAPDCSLTKNVKMVISNVYGRGAITNNGLKMTGESRDNDYCCRVSECCFDSGVHKWKVQVSCYTRHGYYVSARSEVGVIDYDEINEDIANSKKKWVYEIPDNNTNILFTLELDMENRRLKIFAQDHWGRYYNLTKEYQLTAKRVCPFFASTSPSISLSLVECQFFVDGLRPRLGECL